MDVLSDILGVVRISGSVLFWSEFCAPWAILTPDTHKRRPAPLADARRIVLFHIVAQGTCWARCPETDPIEFRAGDVIMVPYGDACVMNDQPDRRPEALPPPPLAPWVDTPPVFRVGGNGEMTRMLCGFLQVDDVLGHPLLAAMPPIFRMRPSQTFPRLQAIVSYALEEAKSARFGTVCTLNRLTEIMFVEVLRQYVEEQSGDRTTPLASLKDPLIGRVLALLHARPSAGWTMAALAREAGTSRSVLADRFNALVGCPPMAYLNRWRMQVASRRLRENTSSIEEIAASVGYASLPSFSKAFKRHIGERPGSWRRREQPRARQQNASRIPAAPADGRVSGRRAPRAED